MKELLEEYVLEVVQMRQQIDFLLRLVTQVNGEGKGKSSFDLSFVKSAPPAIVTVDTDSDEVRLG